jgi:hypothetical protein
LINNAAATADINKVLVHYLFQSYDPLGHFCEEHQKISESDAPPIILLPNLALASLLSRTLQNLLSNHQTPPTGWPSKLSARDQHASLTQITTGKAANAVQATKHINSIISTPVSSETIRRILRKNSFKAVVKKKKPLLSVRHRKARLAFAQKYREWTVED